jgi:murein L,D-transpeptidase YafK
VLKTLEKRPESYNADTSGGNQGVRGYEKWKRIFGRRLLESIITLAAFLAATGIGMPLARGEEVPSTSRSIESIARVQPRLMIQTREMGGHFGAPLLIRIFKMERELELWLDVGNGYALFRRYYVCGASGMLGPKLKEGDLQSPEGFYSVGPAGMNPKSRFHLAFDIGFPNALDRLHGRKGFKVMVHGGCISTGCFAMTDSKMEEIYALAHAALKNGQSAFQVHIFPFHMTDENLDLYAKPKWGAFWDNLREGYEFFEKERRPPQVSIQNGGYRFD